MQVNRGLFRLDLVDHHAVLGVPLDADAKQVRKRYLKIARKLHPDSLGTVTDDQRQQASELLSKLVNPAYETLSQEKASVEHRLSLKLKGQQLQQKPSLLELSTPQSQRVVNSNNVEYEYSTALKTLIEGQYESLDDVFNVIGNISELNAVYVMRQGGAPVDGSRDSADGANAASTVGNDASAAASASGEATKSTVVSPGERRAQLIESFINRAKEFEYKGNFSRAIIELREAVKSHPQNPRVHAQLGRMYMRSKQLKMASIHAKRALEIDEANEVAADVIKRLEIHAKRTAKNTATGQPSKGGDKASVPNKVGGLFGGLFGGNKRK